MSSILIAASDRAWLSQVRNEDLTQRRFENIYRLVDDSRRLVDKKASQLQAIASLSALIAGFAMVVLVESNFTPENLSEWTVFCFATCTALVVAFESIAMITATLVFVGILQFDVRQAVMAAAEETPDQQFSEFWYRRCEKDWQLSFRLFRWGIPLFLCSLAFLGWVRFSFFTPIPIAMSVVAVFAFIIWVVYMSPKWGRIKLKHSAEPKFSDMLRWGRRQSTTGGKEKDMNEDAAEHKSPRVESPV